ncbi:outer membrane beta-barrel protein [Psychroserpens sp.]|uniref:outer membrane beta-barrel protein n=1 Tax=Psychroserpens sp. TaxID=2020870 RepID=UPI001B2BF4E7|nr:outer membrane beta-barrel protein [Psychroserpens sp.]MBO6607294.1 outer membrane beta-barrel protein [Psychroserpens sp.]MBO6654630.1 outer membrane beta-barrel protein [Psychroserpens sp.]MBO6681023.1 outer membrane beta-barrel protein [Psychroserpens sp.]MBO6750022.1 outer membrane beta-barrel protein [Psychroserpens sp.]MBO6915992.1 outer membrane beta-barrel protein [Psychroserpens sp.]
MRNYRILSLLFLLVTIHFNFAQTKADFGVKGGINLTFFQVNEANFGPNTETEVGYYGGVFVDFKIDEDFSIQPEVLYIGLGDFKFINAPIYATYEVAQNFRLLVGPSLNYFFDFFNNKFKVRGDVSAAYNILENLDVHAKYTLGFEEISPNGLFFGLGLKL